MISDRMNRRKFIKRTSALLASSQVPGNLVFGNQTNPLVWEIEGKVGLAVPKLFESLGGLGSILREEPAKSTVSFKA